MHGRDFYVFYALKIRFPFLNFLLIFICLLLNLLILLKMAEVKEEVQDQIKDIQDQMKGEAIEVDVVEDKTENPGKQRYARLVLCCPFMVNTNRL